jgi:hypothetical protein
MSKLCCGALLLLAAAHSSAAVVVNFSGGSGSPLSLSIPEPIAYTVTTAAPNLAPVFVIKATGKQVESGAHSLAGTVTYSINAGAPRAITAFNSGYDGGSIASTDFFFWGAFSALAIGDVVTLSTGTLTTTANNAASPPASGSYATFLSDGGVGNQISGAGATVPEPATMSLLACGVFLLRRDRRPRN